jgi:hypothetical protein
MFAPHDRFLGTKGFARGAPYLFGKRIKILNFNRSGIAGGSVTRIIKTDEQIQPEAGKRLHLDRSPGNRPII